MKINNKKGCYKQSKPVQGVLGACTGKYSGLQVMTGGIGCDKGLQWHTGCVYSGLLGKTGDLHKDRGFFFGPNSVTHIND